MTQLSNFRYLLDYFRARPGVPGVAAAYFRSPSFLDRLIALESDPEFPVQLALLQLSVMALDPNVGTKPAHFIIGGDSPTLGVWLRFHRHANFGGSIVQVPREAPQAAALKQALADNLSSRRFKAAQLDRRLGIRLPRLLAQAAARGQQLAEDIRSPLAELHALRRKAPYYSREAEMLDAQIAEINERAQRVYEKTKERALQHQANRGHRVAEVSIRPDFRGGWVAMLIAAALHLVAPSELQARSGQLD